MGTTEIIALVVVAVAAIAIVAIYMTTSTREFEKRRKQAETRDDEVPADRYASPHSAVDASATEPTEPLSSDTAPRQRRPDREIEEDRARDIARERESHRL